MLSLNIPRCCHISISYVKGFDIEIIHQGIQITCSHTSYHHHFHYCNVSFVSFPNVTCYTNSLLSCIHVNTTYLLNVTCTLVATCMILRRIKCSARWVPNPTWGHVHLPHPFQSSYEYPRVKIFILIKQSYRFPPPNGLTTNTRMVIISWARSLGSFEDMYFMVTLIS